MLQLVLEKIDIIDSIDLIVTKEQGVMKLRRHGFIFHYWKIKQ